MKRKRKSTPTADDSAAGLVSDAESTSFVASAGETLKRLTTSAAGKRVSVFFGRRNVRIGLIIAILVIVGGWILTPGPLATARTRWVRIYDQYRTERRDLEFAGRASARSGSYLDFRNKSLDQIDVLLPRLESAASADNPESQSLLWAGQELRTVLVAIDSDASAPEQRFLNHMQQIGAIDRSVTPLTVASKTAGFDQPAAPAVVQHQAQQSGPRNQTYGIGRSSGTFASGSAGQPGQSGIFPTRASANAAPTTASRSNSAAARTPEGAPGESSVSWGDLLKGREIYDPSKEQ